MLHRPCKEGLGPAYVAGFKFALARAYDAIVQMDADLSHDPAYLTNFFEKIVESDLVVLRDWDSLAVSRWPLSHRADARNWRLSNQQRFHHSCE